VEEKHSNTEVTTTKKRGGIRLSSGGPHTEYGLPQFRLLLLLLTTTTTTTTRFDDEDIQGASILIVASSL